MEVHLLQKCHNDGTFKGSLVEFVFVCYNVLSKSALGNPVCACTCDGQGTNLVSEHSGVTTTTFGDLLKRLRKRAGMTQDDLAAAIGYSRSLVGALERNDRLPDIEVVIQTYLPALGLQEEPLLAAQLVAAAATARGERPPSSFTPKRERHPVITQTGKDETHCFPVPPTEILSVRLYFCWFSRFRSATLLSI